MIKRTGIIIQARIGSKRLPSKVLTEINNQSLLEILFCRLKKCKLIDEIIFAIPNTEENLILGNHIKSFGGKVFFGSEDDVTLRYFNCAIQENLEIIIRVTSDCPLVDFREVDNFVKVYRKVDLKNLYLSNFTPPETSSYCNGSDIEIFSTDMINQAIKKFQAAKDREHVTFQFWDGRFSCNHLKMHWLHKDPINKVRITVDYQKDIEVLNKLSEVIDLQNASLLEICKIYKKLNLFSINGHFDSKAGW